MLCIASSNWAFGTLFTSTAHTLYQFLWICYFGELVLSLLLRPRLTLDNSFASKPHLLLNHPTAITVGYTPVFHIHTAQFAGRVTEIVQKKDPKTGQPVTGEGKDFLKTGDAALIKIKPLKPIVVEKFQDYAPLGRFAIRDMGQTVAAGVVTEVKPKAAA